MWGVRASLVMAFVVCVNAEASVSNVTFGPGTVDVEVRYKDTGEPVEGAVVRLSTVPQEKYPLVKEEITSADGWYTFLGIPIGSYELVVLNLTDPYKLADARSTKFLFVRSEAKKPVTISAAEPTAEVVFEVEPGWRLSGTLKRRDGSPLAGAVVRVDQGDDVLAWAMGMADENGRFDLLGVAPSNRVPVRVFSLYGSVEWDPPIDGCVEIWNGEVELQEESTSLDLEIPTASVDLTFEITQALWPFQRFSEYVARIAREDSSGEVCGDHAFIRLRRFSPEPQSAPGKERYKIALPDFPTDQVFRIRLGITVWKLKGGRLSGSGTSYYRELETLATKEGKQAVIVRTYEPRALLSRAVWFGVPGVLVMAVLLTILVQGVRKRRASHEEG